MADCSKNNNLMKIINKEIIGQDKGVRIVKLEVESLLIAQKALPGQFVIVMLDDKGERIPLTIADKDAVKGTINIIFQETGYSTRCLADFKPGDYLYALLGPLGNPTNIKNYGNVIVIGGGIGIAGIYPVVKSLKKAGCIISSILGAKTKDLLILREAIVDHCKKTYITTDDGSLGLKGLVTDVLKNIIKNSEFNLVYCVGPVIMMWEVAKITKIYQVKTIISLNSTMVDGTGMCGSCRLTEGGKTKLCCVDGPDFDAHKVDFNEIMSRQRRFIKQEKELLGKIS